MGGELALERAEEALRLVQVNLDEAIRLAREVLDATARDGGSPAAASVAERALGLAAVHRQELSASLLHLRQAIRLARRAGSSELAAEARMTYAFALNRSGQATRALTEIGAALAELSSLRHAQGLVQRAAILQQLGRLDEALLDYRAALPALRRADDAVWVQRALLNRGALHAFRHSYGAALRDLKEAQQLSEQRGLALQSAFVHENLLLVHRRLGDVPTALEHLNEAQRIYATLGAPVGSLLVERSELLVSVGLYAEARQAAEEAVAEFSRTANHVHLPEARLLVARTSVLDGRSARAEAETRRAVREFSRQGRAEWRALAECSLLLCRLEDTAARLPVDAVREVADRAEAAGWPGTATDLRLLAGERWLSGRRNRTAREHLVRVAGRRTRGSAVHRVKGWYAVALLRRDDHDLRGSSAAAARGLALLDDYRNTMAATDLRAAVSGLGTGLAHVGLRNSLEGGRPRDVLAWAERGRARHLLQAPVRPPPQPELAALIAELRSVVAEQTERRQAGRSTGSLASREVSLESEIRDASRRGSAHVPRVPPPPSTLDLRDRLGGASLVEFAELDGWLHAVTVAPGGVRLHRLSRSADVGEQVRWLPFALGRLARQRTSPTSAAAALTLVARTAEQLDDLVVRPLAAAVGDGPVVLVPTGLLQSLPWSLLPSLRGRPVTVAPSAGLWLAAADAAPEPGRATVVAGPTLPGAVTEATAVARAYGVVPLLDGEATVDAVLGRVAGTSLLHLAAHGRVRADNPLFSSIQLADGPLTVYELERLHRRIDTVVLAACESARDVVLTGDETIGLSAAFLSRATRHVVASVVVIPDASTGELMGALHRGLAAGVPVADALASAQTAARADDPQTYAAAAGFVCLGHGFSPVAPGLTTAVAAGSGA